MFLDYDLLARRWVTYGYIYPFAELFAGVLMIGGALRWVAGPVALFIGGVGAVSVFKAVYLDKRELKFACVGGDSNVPLGFISHREPDDGRHGVVGAAALTSPPPSLQCIRKFQMPPIIADCRRFVQGVAVAGIVGGSGLRPGLANAAPTAGPLALSGSTFDLVVDETPANVTGRSRTAVTVNGSRPGPTLYWREGDTVTLNVANRL